MHVNPSGFLLGAFIVIATFVLTGILGSPVSRTVPLEPAISIVKTTLPSPHIESAQLEIELQNHQGYPLMAELLATTQDDTSSGTAERSVVVGPIAAYSSFVTQIPVGVWEVEDSHELVIAVHEAFPWPPRTSPSRVPTVTLTGLEFSLSLQNVLVVPGERTADHSKLRIEVRLHNRTNEQIDFRLAYDLRSAAPPYSVEYRSNFWHTLVEASQSELLVTDDSLPPDLVGEYLMSIWLQALNTDGFYEHKGVLHLPEPITATG